ncbi:regulator of Ty1 Transposition [Elasticomyces elasticus]|nr:regulator of Ty1 Transposition [Elasticomyces elasticus]
MAEEAPVKEPLFTDVCIAIIPSEDLDAQETETIIQRIEASGGKHFPLFESVQQIDLSTVTHIISTSIDFPQYSQAVEQGVYVVKPSWVHQSEGKGKLCAARQHSPDPSQFFQDVILTCGDLPDGDKDAIIAGVMALGGQYSGPLTKFVTHLVTLTDDFPKCVTAVEKHAGAKMVLPHWFDACLKLGKKINERPYMFPNPPYRQTILPRPANSDSPHVEGATAAVPTGQLPNTPPPSPSKHRKNLNAFAYKKVFLGADLNIPDHLKKTLGDLINHGGGTMTEKVDDCHIYIGQFRDGVDYVAASRARKEVANLAWLYHVINVNKYTNPLSKLLHYPIPRHGIDGFQNLKISISSYSGDARIYLENLIHYCGAEFTKTMKQDNSHLITAHTRSEKFEAAQEWNINVTNHLWLEECYAKCTVMTVSNNKYTEFPPVTNLGEVCGQTVLDMKAVERIYFPAPRESPVKSVTAAQKKPARTAVPASSMTVASYTPSKSAAISAPIPIAEDDDEEDDEEEPRPQTAKKPRSRTSKAAPTPAAEDVLMLDDDETAAEPTTAPRSRGRPRKSAATPRLLNNDKENGSPAPRTSGRAAANIARAAIHNAAPDIALYEKESKRKGGVTHGGRRSGLFDEPLSSPIPQDSKKGKKRKSDEHTYDVTAQDSELSDGETQARLASKGTIAKKAKTTLTVKYRMMVTGDDRWVGNMKKESDDKIKLKALGVELTTNPRDDNGIDILVAPGIKRTKKFVAALASAPMVVDSKYLDYALSKNKLMDSPPMLVDRKSEEVMGCTLADALERAKTNKRRLLRGWNIYVTEGIVGGFDTYKEIIEVNGGVATLYKGRTGLKITKRMTPDEYPDAGDEVQHQGGEEEYENVYLVSSEKDADVKLWKTLRSLVEKQGLKPRIVESNWLLNAAMSQQVSWDEKWELDEAKVVSQRDR